MKASDLKPGDKVFFLGDIEATVRSFERNGIRITYWGIGFLNRDKQVTERVSIRTLTPREDLYK